MSTFVTTNHEKTLALAALREVRPQQYRVVELYLAGMKQSAIAAVLGTTQGNVSRTLARGLKSLESLKKKLAARRMNNL